MPTVEELPDTDPKWIEAKTHETRPGIRVEKEAPVIKLLAEHNIRIAYGFAIVFHPPTR